MGPIIAVVAVGTVLALAFSSSRNTPRPLEVGPDRRSAGQAVLAQGLRASRP